MTLFGGSKRIERSHHVSIVRDDPDKIDPVYQSLTPRELTAYAKRLQQGDRSLTWEKAMELAREHENQRFTAHLQNVAPKLWKK